MYRILTYINTLSTHLVITSQCCVHVIAPTMELGCAKFVTLLQLVTPNEMLALTSQNYSLRS